MNEMLTLSRPRAGVLLAELNRPEVLNALNPALNAALTRMVEEAGDDGETRVLVLAGAGDRAFSAGADLKEMRSLSGASLRRSIEASWVPCEALARSPLVSIAALHGHVLGGGAELALACDLRVADSTLSLGFPEMILGSIPGSGGLQRLPGLIGTDAALALVATGERLIASECRDLGLVTRLAGEGETAREAAVALAARIAERPAEPLRCLKAALALAGNPDAARSFHGFASATFQAEPDYHSNTKSFHKEVWP